MAVELSTSNSAAPDESAAGLAVDLNVKRYVIVPPTSPGGAKTIGYRTVLEILGALLGTFFFTRIAAGGFKPAARRAVFAALVTTATIPWLALAMNLMSAGTSERTIAELVVLCGLCVGVVLLTDLWQVRQRERLADERAEAFVDREAKRMRVEQKWTRAIVSPEQGVAPHSNSCSACGAQVLPEARFCDSCGGVLGNQCPKCNAANRHGARFCKHCGDPLPGGSAAASAEGSGA